MSAKNGKSSSISVLFIDMDMIGLSISVVVLQISLKHKINSQFERNGKAMSILYSKVKQVVDLGLV